MQLSRNMIAVAVLVLLAIGGLLLFGIASDTVSDDEPTNAQENLSVEEQIALDNRDFERKLSLEAAEGHIEAYAARNGEYPSTELVEQAINDDEVLAANFPGMDRSSLIDPNGEPYEYENNTDEICGQDERSTCRTSYVLCADLETDGVGSEDSDVDTCDEARSARF